MTARIRKCLLVALLAFFAACVLALGLPGIASTQTVYAAIDTTGKLTGDTVLSGNMTLNNYMLSVGNIDGSEVSATIFGNGYKITRSTASYSTGRAMITVNRGATLKIINATIDGGFNFTYNSIAQEWQTTVTGNAPAPIIQVNSGGRLILDNCIVQNNRYAGDGAGIHIASGGAMDFFDSTVQQCQAVSDTWGGHNGGGIYNAGIVAIVGGEIKNNYAQISESSGSPGGKGGGICSVGALYINGKNGYADSQTEIDRNIAWYGGGIYIGGSGNNPEAWITGSNSGDSGGIVSITRNIAGKGKVYDQTAVGHGGGIYVESSNVHIWNNVQITQNSANSGGGIYGAGMYLGKEEETTERMSIWRNTANVGGGVYAVTDIRFGQVDIQFNEASGKGGGGIYVSDKNVTTTNPVEITSSTAVSGNSVSSANGEGGGIYAAGFLRFNWNPYITNNTKEPTSSTKSNSNVCLAKNGKIVIINDQAHGKDSGTLSVPIGLSVTSDTASDKALTTGWATANRALDYVFVPDNPKNQRLVIKDGEVKLEKLITITFNPRDCNGSSYSETYVIGESYQLTSRFSRPGYTQRGWTNNPNSTAVTFALDEYITPNANTPTTLYPVWSNPISYVLRYNFNGSPQGNSTARLIYGEQITLPRPSSPYPGYVFKGWSFSQTATSPTYTGGQSFTYNYTEDKTLYAVWAKEYNVTFTGGAGVLGDSPDPFAKCKGDTFNLPDNPYTKSGYTFAGWSDGSNVYQPGASYTMPGSDVAFSAQWEFLGYEYTVEHWQQNIENDNYTIVTGDTQTLCGTGQTAAQAKTYTGFTAQSFSQTAINENGSTVVKIYYDRNEYSITFDANGGQDAPATITAKYGASITFPTAKPTNRGKTFQKWNTRPDGNGTTVTGYTTMPLNGAALYAIWQARAVSNIEIPTEFKSQSYHVNEPLKTFSIAVTYDNGESENVTVTTSMLTNFSTAQAFSGTKTATVSYGNKTDTFTYTVSNRKYSITYDAGGASGQVPTNTPQTAGSTVTLLEPTGLTKTGYVFDKWLYSYDNKTYAAGATITMPAENVTFTAQWKLAPPTLSTDIAENNLSFKYDGKARTITVTPSHDLGVSYTYRWYRGAPGALGNPISGATGASYSVTNVADSGIYNCIVSATLGSETSLKLVSVTVTIDKGDQAALTLSQDEFTYNGNDIGIGQCVSGGSGDGTVALAVSDLNGVAFNFNPISGTISGISKAGGTFTLTVTKAQSANYNAKEQSFTVTLNKGTQTLTIGEQNNLVFGDEPQITVTGSTGTLTYSVKENGGTATGTITSPGGKLTVTDLGESGTITVVVKAAATDLFAAAQAEKQFTFAKGEYDAAPEWETNIPEQSYTVCVGKSLDNLLPNFWTWEEGQPLPTAIGNHTVTAIFTPANPNNYESTEGNITVIIAAHTGGTATCTQKAVCTRCGDEYGAKLAHSYGAWVEHTDTQHKKVCTMCDTETQYANHTWNNGAITQLPTHMVAGIKTFTCTANCGATRTEPIPTTTAHNFNRQVVDGKYLASEANCTTPALYYYSCECGEKGTVTFENGNALGHAYASEWSKDASGHWRDCSRCDEKGSFATHTPDRQSPTETDAVKCTICEYTITPATGHIDHTSDNIWHSDGTEHWNKCTGCEEKMNISAHSGGTATCESKAQCGICHTKYGNLAAHTYGAWEKHDASQHKRVCTVCDNDTQYENHNWNDGEVTTPPTHTETGIKTITCEDCEQTKTETVPAITDHTYNQEVVRAEYLKSEATCTSPAVYFKSCICGEKGTETFTYGNALGHNYEFTETVAPNLKAQTDGYDLYTCSHDSSHTEQRNVVEWETLIPKVTVTVSGGSIEGYSGNTAIVNKDGSIKVIAAAPEEGKAFKGWSDGENIVSTDMSYTFTAVADVTLTAVYENAVITPPDDKPGLSSGAIAGIAVGGTAAAALGGFSIFWFGIKKKKFSDLFKHKK